MPRLLLLILAALSLAACNAVVSEKPLFSGRSSPGLKPGLWAMIETPDCAFDATAPTTQWPECADAVVLDGREIRDPAAGKSPLRYVLARGAPRILQIEMADEDDRERKLYFYMAVEPTSAARGPITEARAWLVQCGPPPEGGANNGLTQQPLPGFAIRDNTCIAVAAGPVRAAAGPSRGWDEVMTIRWVRARP